MSDRQAAAGASIKSITRRFLELLNTKIQSKKLLILDLDETLIHSVESSPEDETLQVHSEESSAEDETLQVHSEESSAEDETLQVHSVESSPEDDTLQVHSEESSAEDETLQVHSEESSAKPCALSYTDEDGYTYSYYLRPYVHKFLERVSELFDVVIFTASVKDYADQILDFLDPQGTLIVRRYYRSSVVYLPDGSSVKDLSIFKADLAKVILVDNCPANFRLQKNNGIPIKSWYSDPQDEELSKLLPFLERLAAADDVRPIIAERFSHRKIE